MALMPDETRVHLTRLTPQALFYLGEHALKHKLLCIEEEAGTQGASYSLRTMQSQKELTIASTGKDPQSGKLETHTYRVAGPVALLLTTTEPRLDEETQSRFVVLAVDESPAQTQRILQQQRQAETVEGLKAKLEREAIVQRHHAAQRLLREDLQVVNPLAPSLVWPEGRLRARRDQKKLLALLRAVAYLRQAQKEVQHLEAGGREVAYVEVDQEDVAIVRRLAPVVLGPTLDELSVPARRLLDELRRLGKPRLSRREARRRSAGATTRSRRTCASSSSWSTSPSSTAAARACASSTSCCPAPRRRRCSIRSGPRDERAAARSVERYLAHCGPAASPPARSSPTASTCGSSATGSRRRRPSLALARGAPRHGAGVPAAPAHRRGARRDRPGASARRVDAARPALRPQEPLRLGRSGGRVRQQPGRGPRAAEARAPAAAHADVDRGEPHPRRRQRRAPLDLRDRAMLEVLWATGMRIKELAELELLDVDLTAGELYIRHGKGNKTRLVPLTRRPRSAAVEQYLSHGAAAARPRRRADEPPLRHGRRAAASARTTCRCASPACACARTCAAASRRTPGATAWPRSSSRPAPICAPSRSCSATSRSRPPSATPASTSATSSASSRSATRGNASATMTEVDAYLVHLEAVGRTPATLADVGYWLGRLRRLLDPTPLRDATRDDLDRFAVAIGYLAPATRGPGPLVPRGLLPLARARRPHPRSARRRRCRGPACATSSTRARCSARPTSRACSTRPTPTTPIGLRDRAVLELLYGTGLRRQELAGLDLGDWLVSEGVVLVRRGKRRKERLVPLGRCAAAARRRLPAPRPHGAAGRGRDAALFVTRSAAASTRGP